MALTLMDFANQTQTPLQRGVVQEITNESVFLRRLRFIVDFPAHGEGERKEIWRRIFPAATRTEGLDLDRLSRLGLNGGAINNVAMNAAFLAAAADTAVTMPHVLAAARVELQKLGRPINEADFRWTAPAPVAAEKVTA